MSGNVLSVPIMFFFLSLVLFLLVCLSFFGRRGRGNHIFNKMAFLTDGRPVHSLDELPVSSSIFIEASTFISMVVLFCIGEVKCAGFT